MEDTFSTMDRWMNAFHGCEGGNLAKLQDPDSLYKLRRCYYALVTYVDRKVGQLMAALEETGLAENTAIIFTSDHGDMLCEKAMVQKRIFYDWASRVPLIVTTPDGTGAGTTVEEAVSLIDLLPTCLDLAGMEASERLPYDGSSLLPLIDGEAQIERHAFSEMHGEGVFAPCIMVRQGRYKYIYVHGHDAQLFDLEADPGEWHNLVGREEYAEVEAKLRGLILDRFDPEAIELDVRESIARRRLIQRALMANGTTWSAAPNFGSGNALGQYL
jgi:choline-sulfatase